MKISGLATPALIADVNTLKANAEAMRRVLENSSLKLRPHFKSHKCASIAKWQISCGAIGMTCAKLSEAEDLCDAGVEDILIANQIVDPVKIRRLADLAGNCRLTVCRAWGRCWYARCWTARYSCWGGRRRWRHPRGW